MPWLKLVHLAAVVVWCGALPYLAFALATAGEPPRRAMPRALFNTVATPAALIAIASGTAIFVFDGPTAGWLIAKLMLVALLVLGHAVAGVLVLRVERDGGAMPVAGGLVLAWTLGGLGAIAWIVLAKPGAGGGAGG